MAELILKDSGFINEKDAEYANRKGFSRHKPALPLYDVRDAARAMERFVDVPFGTEVELPGGATLKFRYASHILGAATVDIEWGGRRVVFSGDLGRYSDPMLPDPDPVPEADYIVIESTYGNRTHEHTNTTEILGEVIERTARRGGTVIIPSFAIGRAQSLLYHLWKLQSAGRIAGVPVYLDSPMAINATDLLHTHIDDHRLTADECAAVCNVATYTRDVESSKGIIASRWPKVVISASGMASGGRVLHHLKSFVTDPKNTILFAGYQAAGTRGSAMVQSAEEIKIHGQWLPVRAEIADLSMLSSHADSNELMHWLSSFQREPSRVFVVHGEDYASEALRDRIDRELGWNVAVPRQDQSFDL